MRSSISPHFLVRITVYTLVVLWIAIICYSGKHLPKIKGTTVYSEKEHLCHEFWKKFLFHVCCKTVFIAVSLVLLCYTQKMYLTENTYYCPLKNVVTCSIVPHWDKDPIIHIIGGMVFLLVLCVWTIYDAIRNKEEFIKDLVNLTTGNEEGDDGNHPRDTMRNHTNTQSHNEQQGRERKRRRWTRAQNVMVMECYYKSRLSRNSGYMRRMRNFWIEEGMLDISQEVLAAHARSILKGNLLSGDELKEIKDRVGFQEEEERQGPQDR